MLETNGAELLKYHTELELTLSAALKLNGKKPYLFASTALLQILRSLVYIYPLENRISEADFDDPSYLAIKVSTILRILKSRAFVVLLTSARP